MSDLKSGLILEDGESLAMEIEAELWAASSNSLSKSFEPVKKFFAKIFGHKSRGFIVITNKRIVEVKKEIMCFCFNKGTHASYILPNSMKEIGFVKKSTCGCCPAYYAYYQCSSHLTTFMLNSADENEAQKTVDAIYKAVVAAQSPNA